MSKINAILDYLADHEYEAKVHNDPSQEGAPTIEVVSGLDGRTALLPVSYLAAKAFVEKRHPYDK